MVFDRQLWDLEQRCHGIEIIMLDKMSCTLFCLSSSAKYFAIARVLLPLKVVFIIVESNDDGILMVKEGIVFGVSQRLECLLLQVLPFMLIGILIHQESFNSIVIHDLLTNTVRQSGR